MRITLSSVLITCVLSFAGLGLPTATAARLVGKPAPEITSDTWLHSEPLDLEGLRGKVVLLEFWTYG